MKPAQRSFYYVRAAPGHAEKSGNARVGPSARAIIAAYDGHEGRLALPWEMRKARPPPPIGAAPACPANIKPQAPGHPKNWPKSSSGDAGFATEANLAALKERWIRGYLPPGRGRHGEAHAAGRRR